MAQCVYCDTETQLFANGMPICIKCDSTNVLVAELRKSSNNENHGGGNEGSGTNGNGSRSISC
jgi:hypothetical protein